LPPFIGEQWPLVKAKKQRRAGEKKKPGCKTLQGFAFQDRHLWRRVFFFRNISFNRKNINTVFFPILATSSTSLNVRDTSTKFAPSLAKIIVDARPTPELAPVIMATLLANLILLLLQHIWHIRLNPSGLQFLMHHQAR
jgi:hypothetical protein